MKKIILILLVISMLPLYAEKDFQDKGHGISASLQAMQLDINLPIATGKSTLFIPSVGMTFIEDYSTAVNLGLGWKFYSGDKAVKSFWGPRAGVLMNLNSDTDNTTNLFFGLALGGDYFVNEFISLGIEAQLNLIKSDQNSSMFGNPGGITANTGTAIYATIWL